MSRRPYLACLAWCLIGALGGCHDVRSRSSKTRTGDTVAALPAARGPASASHLTTRPREVLPIDILSIWWSADGSLLATNSSDRSITVWESSRARPDIPTKYGRYTLNPPLHAVRIQSNGHILIENTQAEIKVRHFATGKLLQTLEQSEHVFEWPFFLSPNGTKVYSFHAHRQEVNVWNARTGKLVDVCIPTGNRKIETVLGISPDGKEAYVVLESKPVGNPEKGMRVHDGLYALNLGSGQLEQRALSGPSRNVRMLAPIEMSAWGRPRLGYSGNFVRQG